MSNNKIIRIWGGLGNQLFQYSYGKFLEEKLEKEILFNIEWFNQSNNRRFILQDILKFTNETSEKKISLIQKVANYRMENTYKYLSKKNFYLLPETLIGYWQDIFFANYLKIHDFKDNFFSQSIKNLEKVDIFSHLEIIPPSVSINFSSSYQKVLNTLFSFEKK